MPYKARQNFFDPNSFYVQFILDNGREDNLKYNIKSTELPDINFGMTTINKGGRVVYIQGTTRDEGSITLELLLDEELYVYTDVLELGKEYLSKNFTIDQMQVFIFSNQNQPILRFDFQDIFFSNISAPRLGIDDKDTEQYVTVTVNFKKFEYKRL